jgi:hypothetical protein
MMPSTPPPPPRAETWLVAGCATLSLLLSIGCANPGPPHPPSLRLPALVKDLTASRAGDHVELHWTTPAKTTDGLLIKGTLTAEICRVASPAPSPTAPHCTPVKRLAVQPGPSQTTEDLPRSLTLDPPVLLTYRVQIFNTNQHSAGLSAPAFAASGAAPPPVEQLRAKSIRSGAMVEWQPQTTAATVELDRVLDGTAPASPKAKPPAKPNVAKPNAAKSKSKPGPKPSAQPAKSPLQSKPATPDEVKLRTPPSPSDAGGTLDRTVQMGQNYRYTAHRVRTITLDGHSLEIRSPLSPPVTLLARDTFPPSAPTGLAAVPSGDTPANRSIDLSWEPDTESDLAGYIVYRQSVAADGTPEGPISRLTPTPVDAPAFSDQTAQLGHRYAYHVTAVDTVGNESAPSIDVQEGIREQ